MTTKVQKWGNSLAVRLPKSLTARWSLYNGSPVIISEDALGIKIRPAEDGFTDLKSMIKKINKFNRHEEIDFGPPVGKELI